MSLFNKYSFFFSVRSVMHKYLEKKEEVNFDKIFNQVLGNLEINVFTVFVLLHTYLNTI